MRCSQQAARSSTSPCDPAAARLQCDPSLHFSQMDWRRTQEPTTTEIENRLVISTSDCLTRRLHTSNRVTEVKSEQQCMSPGSTSSTCAATSDDDDDLFSPETSLFRLE